MAEIQPRISVAYKENATIIAFTDEKILEETDVRALRGAVESVVEQARGHHRVPFSEAREDAGRADQVGDVWDAVRRQGDVVPRAVSGPRGALSKLPVVTPGRQPHRCFEKGRVERWARVHRGPLYVSRFRSRS